MSTDTDTRTAAALARVDSTVSLFATLAGATVALTVKCPGGFHTRTGVVESTFGTPGDEELLVRLADRSVVESHSTDVVVVRWPIAPTVSSIVKGDRGTGTVIAGGDGLLVQWRDGGQSRIATADVVVIGHDV